MQNAINNSNKSEKFSDRSVEPDHLFPSINHHLGAFLWGKGNQED
jgi:hypothetical protein